MRVTKTNDELKVHAVAGTYVVLFGLNMPEADCAGLLGFAIHRVDHTENEAYFLEGMKAFAETDPGFPPARNIRRGNIRSRAFNGPTTPPSQGTATRTRSWP